MGRAFLAVSGAGLTVAEFVRREKVKPVSKPWWRKRLGQMIREAEMDVSFVPLVNGGASSRTEPSVDSVIEVQLPNTLVLRLPVGVEPSKVVELVRIRPAKAFAGFAGRIPPALPGLAASSGPPLLLRRCRRFHTVVGASDSSFELAHPAQSTPRLWYPEASDALRRSMLWSAILLAISFFLSAATGMGRAATTSLNPAPTTQCFPHLRAALGLPSASTNLGETGARSGAAASTTIGGISRFRYYDPELGRHLSEDPIGVAGGVALFGYVHEPLGWVDWFGLSGGCGDATDAASKKFSAEKQALVDMAQRDARTGISAADLQAYKELNQSLPDPFPSNMVRGPEAHPNRPHGKHPHCHVGVVDHIPFIGS